MSDDSADQEGDMFELVKDKNDDGKWKISYMKEMYSIDEIPDPGCPPVVACMDELKGLDPAELLRNISNTIVCLKIGINGFAACGDWKTQNDFWNFGHNVSELLRGIETSMWKMKVDTDDIVGHLQIAMIYKVEGHDSLSKDSLCAISSKADKIIEELEPVTLKLQGKLDELEDSDLYRSWQTKQTAMAETRRIQLEELKVSRRSAKDRALKLDRQRTDIDEKITEAKGERFKLLKGTKKRVKAMEKECQKFLQENEDLEINFKRMEEDLEAENDDALWLVLPTVVGTLRSMRSCIEDQISWWKELAAFIKPKFDDGASLPQEIVPSVFKLRVVKMYFMLVAVGRLAFHSKNYLHRCNEEFGKAITENPNQEQGQANLRPLLGSQEEYTTALMQGIKADVEGDMQEYQRQQEQKKLLAAAKPKRASTVESHPKSHTQSVPTGSQTRPEGAYGGATAQVEPRRTDVQLPDVQEPLRQAFVSVGVAFKNLFSPPKK